MKKYFSYLLLLLLFTQTVKAHQTEVSTTMLVENENKTWVLQISASLTAFQKEIRMHYAETPYKTPEEFKQMVLEYVKSNLVIEFNNKKQSIILGEGVVKLGHETKVVFEVFGVPETINSVLVKNETFKDIHRNQSALVILKAGVERKQFVLDADNNHLIDLELDGNTFQRVEEQNISASSINIILIILVLLVFGVIAQKLLLGKKLNRTE